MVKGNRLDSVFDTAKDIITSVLPGPEVVNNLEYIKGFDGYTFNHSLRVSALSIICGMNLSFNERQLRTICMGALLHDLGKTCLNKTVLDKPGKLSFGEFEHIKLHSEFGFNLLMEMGLEDDIAEIALHHHERFDGSGYPLGFSSHQINQFAKIIAVADVFEALTADRVYRKAYSVPDAVEIIRECERTQFDPQVTKAFLSSLGKDLGSGYNALLKIIHPQPDTYLCMA